MTNDILSLIFISLSFIFCGIILILWCSKSSYKLLKEDTPLPLISITKIVLGMFFIFVSIFAIISGMVFLTNALALMSSNVYMSGFDSLNIPEHEKLFKAIDIGTTIAIPIVTILGSVAIATLGYIVKNKKED